MKVWVTRDSDTNQMYDYLNVWKKKPYRFKGAWFPESGLDGYKTHKKVIQMILGFTPRKGSIGQYELSLKEIT